jgi:hypothetical protein
VQVKANQPTLLQNCLSTATTQTPLAVYQEPVAKAHNRIESRIVSGFAPQSIREVEKVSELSSMA